ncbi:MAG: bifunctional folylpolyglutamate synthase/dihydrofolate synthase [Clostridiaceae bacterium]|jgi:dihydrofolate synthase/folylpolyglutamate synthase|nr:bifunctional folylpolyglutamate synthase/dihydrofolate synthase [Clostridiaceae bacterium]
MNYQEARQFLASAMKYGIKLDLERMQQLMHVLHNPQKTLRFIHIAGTNGKGTTTAYCGSILAAANHRVGLYTSPYLVRFTERIRVIDGREGFEKKKSDEAHGEIEPESFARLMTTVAEAVDRMLAAGGEHPTEFELLTAVGFLYFKERDCDIVVLETGLGGRLDATNIIEKSLASIITALGYDHTERLGDSLASIASEKAGIVKRGCPVFLYDPQALTHLPSEKESALKVVRERCQTLQAPMHLISPDDYSLTDYDWSGQTFMDTQTGQQLTTRLLGTIQPMNAMLAVRTCRALGLADDQAVAEGIAAARWPARLELIRQNPPILIDGAHNVQSCQALRDSLKRLVGNGPVVFLAGMLADKDVTGMLQTMILNHPYHLSGFVCVRPVNERALPEAELAERVRCILQELPDGRLSRYNEPVCSSETLEDGARLALKLARSQNACLCVFGSLYLVGEIRQIYLEQEA